MSQEQTPTVLTTQTTALNKAETPPDPLATIKVYANMDIATAEGRANIYNMMVGPADEIEYLVGEEIELCGFISHQAEATDEQTGEVRQYNRTLLLRPEGNPVSCGSDVIADQLTKIRSFVREAPWKPPLTVKVHAQRSKKKRTFYSLLIVKS